MQYIILYYNSTQYNTAYYIHSNPHRGRLARAADKHRHVAREGVVRGDVALLDYIIA